MPYDPYEPRLTLALYDALLGEDQAGTLPAKASKLFKELNWQMHRVRQFNHALNCVLGELLALQFGDPRTIAQVRARHEEEKTRRLKRAMDALATDVWTDRDEIDES